MVYISYGHFYLQLLPHPGHCLFIIPGMQEMRKIFRNSSSHLIIEVPDQNSCNKSYGTLSLPSCFQNIQITFVRYQDFSSHKISGVRRCQHMPVIPSLGRQRQPGIYSEFQDSQGCTEKPILGGWNLSYTIKFHLSKQKQPTSLPYVHIHKPKKKLFQKTWNFCLCQEHKCGGRVGSEWELGVSSSWGKSASSE